MQCQSDIMPWKRDLWLVHRGFLGGPWEHVTDNRGQDYMARVTMDEQGRVH